MLFICEHTSRLFAFVIVSIEKLAVGFGFFVDFDLISKHILKIISEDLTILPFQFFERNCSLRVWEESADTST